MQELAQLCKQREPYRPKSTNGTSSKSPTAPKASIKVVGSRSRTNKAQETTVPKPKAAAGPVPTSAGKLESRHIPTLRNIQDIPTSARETRLVAHDSSTPPPVLAVATKPKETRSRPVVSTMPTIRTTAALIRRRLVCPSCGNEESPKSFANHIHDCHINNEPAPFCCPYESCQGIIGEAKYYAHYWNRKHRGD